MQVVRPQRDDDATRADEQNSGQAIERRKRTSRQEALAVDGAKVMRVMVWAAIKRRMPQGLARALKRHKPCARSLAGEKRKREETGGGTGEERCATRPTPPDRNHM